jgi:hypothetical protein
VIVMVKVSPASSPLVGVETITDVLCRAWIPSFGTGESDGCSVSANVTSGNGVGACSCPTSASTCVVVKAMEMGMGMGVAPFVGGLGVADEGYMEADSMSKTRIWVDIMAQFYSALISQSIKAM